MLILIGELESFFVIETFLNEAGLVLTSEQVAGHLMHLIMTAGDVVM